MTLALEIAFAASFAIVAASLVAVVFARVPERLLLGSAVALAVVALAAAVLAGIAIVEGNDDVEALLVATGGILIAAMAQAGLFALARGLRQIAETERLGEQARKRMDEYLEEHAEQRKAEVERMLARERANTSYALGEQERQLAEERRDTIERQAERARVELADAVSSAQERLESRLMAWAADLDRGQRELEAQLGQLGQRQKEALVQYDARLRDDAERLAAASEEQRRALEQLRSEFERLITQFVEEGRSEVETHAAERRRSLHEVSERLRNRERGLREQIDREEVEARSRLAAGLNDAERRQLAQLEKALERAASRLSDDAERRFDALIRESREKSAERLSRELEKSIEQFVRQAESEVSDRIIELARTTADRMERRLRDVARGAEAQGEVASERLRHVQERLDSALAAAESRIATFEDEVDQRLGSKLELVDRSARAAERD
jgi:chromosome segregation ATPase